jgi:diacylglycerol kinase (ATP)
VEWDETCASGSTETPSQSPSSRGKPLLCFVNGKSGGRRGAALMELLANRDDINAVEIVDLTAEGPTASLRRHVGVVPDLRVLVCGGDGTVAWVLQAMEELGEVRREDVGPNLGPKTAFPTHFFFRSVRTLTKKHLFIRPPRRSATFHVLQNAFLQTFPRPPIGILPLGTGNDLARVFGWGSRYDDRLLDRLASALDAAETKQLDRWDVDFVRQKSAEDVEGKDSFETSAEVETSGVCGQSVSTRKETPATPEKKQSVTLHNYLGVGVDAKAALAFHEAREKNPKLFFSSITNKALYGVFGAVDFVTHSCRDLLRDHVKITADGVPLKIPRNAEGIIVLNLNSYAGGARMWDAGERGTHRKNIVGAALSGGYEDTEEDTSLFLSSDECDGEGVLMEVRDDSDDDDDEMVDAQQSSRRKKRLRTIFGKSKRDDGLVDVVAVYGALHLGQLSWGTDRPVRLRQARVVKIEVSKAFPVHVDGQPWEERNGATLTIKRRDKVGVLAADPASLTSLGSGRGYESLSGRVPSEGGSFWGNTFLGWESWEDLEYYDDLTSAPHSCVRSMLD